MIKDDLRAVAERIRKDSIGCRYQPPTIIVPQFAREWPGFREKMVELNALGPDHPLYVWSERVEMK